LPDIPTVAEFLPGFEASGWLGVGAPKNTPAEIVDILNKQINAGLADSKVKTSYRRILVTDGVRRQRLELAI
jgi:tripartite-type tricarboxylate transporter receptor subunit TctC